MTTPTSRLRSVLEQIPFDLDDTDAVNDAFKQWSEDDSEAAKRNVDLWTYCYIWRYFLSKSARGSVDDPSDVDDLIARAYKKVEDGRTDIRRAGRYASWVSVICKNTFLNYARRDRVSQSIDADEGPELRADPDGPFDDVGYVRQAFEEAIHRLPTYLQETARLYFLENKSFKEVAEVIGKTVATVRTYKYKAVKRLRDDDQLRDVLNPPSL